MSLTVVLVRHGEPKRKKLGETDFERTLTDWGAKVLRESYPQTMGILHVTPQSELWFSPAARALQTAEIANETLGIKTQRELPYLYEQDIDAFLDDLSQAEADLVVVVGHIPFMEEACSELCGQYVRFTPGTAAIIRIEDGKGRLVRVVEGPM